MRPDHLDTGLLQGGDLVGDLELKSLKVVRVLTAVELQAMLELEIFLPCAVQTDRDLLWTGDIKDIYKGSLQIRPRHDR